ncbi:N-sulfoglucosamine sulfohydrolase [Planctomycetales bacterium 10988]|nr:N-sulfoglucosamine sulfohydrolase [Planctomycetales bacterium 10988]
MQYPPSNGRAASAWLLPFKTCLTLSAILAGVFLFSEKAAADDRPNFILFIADDVSWNDLSCYGSPNARTPEIDAIAANGMQFEEAYLTASSCSPSRSSIITGRYPHNNGEAAELHRPISAHIPAFPGVLRDKGYYTALAGKDHMTWKKPESKRNVPTEPFVKKYGTSVPGNNGGEGYWLDALHDCPKDQPFFLWLASTDAHRDWGAELQWDEEEYGPRCEPGDVDVPPYLVDTLWTRIDLACYYNEVRRFDHFVGKTVKELEKMNLADNTYLIILADNGRPFPRAKTRLHDSGMKTYFIMAGPKVQSGSKTSALTSVIDIAPTVMELAGVKEPKTLQGRSLLPVLQDPSQSIRPLAFSEHNWHDYEAHGRSVRDGRYLLIRNFRPNLAWQGPADSVRSVSFRDLVEASLNRRKKLTLAQKDVLLAPRPEVELYDTSNDPYQTDNLAGSAEFADIEQRLTQALDHWMEATDDSVPEVVSPDQFDRETGNRISPRVDYVDPPGADRDADRNNSEGL